ncbi:MAG: aminotransferase class I/II-fold pyridoxal phosphate-dependent enzyme [Saprospiraceae bacterium]
MKEIQKAYDAEQFRQQGHSLVDLLADRLAASTTGIPKQVLPWQETETAMQTWIQDFAKAPDTDITGLFKKVLEESINVHHPKYMGHQISPAAPLGALAGLVSDFLNNGMGVYEMGIVGTIMDRIVIRSVAAQMGFDQKADGVMTSGGTMANVTALLTARSIKAKDHVWVEGTQKQYALMVSEQAHYCVDRAARIMGWGAEGIIKVPSNANYEMRTETLEAYFQKAKTKGIEVLAVVGSACSTSTGAFDDLEAIADFCEMRDLWFHVDGAHGAATVYSEKYKGLVNGLERADSVTMDFHKMLLTPSITTALVFKNGKLNFQTFAQEAQYLFEEQEGLDWYNMARRTFECTKTMMSLKIYSLLRTYGPGLFDEYVTRVIDNTHELHQLVNAMPEMEAAAPPSANILCFRHRPAHLSSDQLNQHNEGIRHQMKLDGDYYIVKTSLNGQTYLRCTLTNPFTNKEHLQGLLDKVGQIALEI